VVLLKRLQRGGVAIEELGFWVSLHDFIIRYPLLGLM
jgi:hypothetical protein